jgi:hypothetical protein
MNGMLIANSRANSERNLFNWNRIHSFVSTQNVNVIGDAEIISKRADIILGSGWLLAKDKKLQKHAKENDSKENQLVIAEEYVRAFINNLRLGSTLVRTVAPEYRLVYAPRLTAYRLFHVQALVVNQDLDDRGEAYLLHPGKAVMSLAQAAYAYVHLLVALGGKNDVVAPPAVLGKILQYLLVGFALEIPVVPILLSLVNYEKRAGRHGHDYFVGFHDIGRGRNEDEHFIYLVRRIKAISVRIFFVGDIRQVDIAEACNVGVDLAGKRSANLADGREHPYFVEAERLAASRLARD